MPSSSAGRSGGAAGRGVLARGDGRPGPADRRVRRNGQRGDRPSAENEGILISVWNNRSTMAYGIDAFNARCRESLGTCHGTEIMPVVCPDISHTASDIATFVTSL
jgi:hypothetical protein